MPRKLFQGLSFFARSAAKFSRLGFENKGLRQEPVEADFAGQCWLVTGASGGIGREIVVQAFRRGAHVLVAARSASKLNAMIDETQGPGRILPIVADLSSMEEIRRLVDDLAQRECRLDVLVNNVGVLLNDHSLTDEGFERSFATNLLGHYLLTELAIARELLARGALVINMSSGGMYTEALDPAALDVTDPAHHDGVRVYARHKRAQVELTRHWNARYGPDITFHAMHPGWVDTDGVRTSLPGFRRIFGSVLRTAQQGADTAIWLAARQLPASADGGIWLDRDLEPEHLRESTRTSDETRGQLVEMLRKRARIDGGDRP